MDEITWAHPKVRACLAALKLKKPFVYGLTNYVAANLSANVLLALGAAPAIGGVRGWPEAFGAAAGAMWINSAALMSDDAETLIAAASAAQAAGTPWVLDPVAIGAGVAQYDAVIRELLAFGPTVIRGNASELIALAGGASSTRGVETTTSSHAAIASVREFAARMGAVIAVSGKTDYVTDGGTIVAIPGGDARLTQVTGAGCSLGATIAALLATSGTWMDAACTAHALFAVAAERAAPARGTGSFAVALVDQLSLLDPDE